jgi:hypothetical protein
MLRVVFLRQKSHERHTSLSVSQHSVVTLSLTLIQIRVHCGCMHKGSLSSNFSGLPDILAQRFTCINVVRLCASFQKQQYTPGHSIYTVYTAYLYAILVFTPTTLHGVISERHV